MQDIQKMTDAELVEAVAREVLKLAEHDLEQDQAGTVYYAINNSYGRRRVVSFDPFTDMNDLFMVLEKFDKYRITKGHNNWYGADVWIAENVIHGTYSKSIPRAVLEACLSAERGKG